MRNGTRTTNLVTCNLKFISFYSSLMHSQGYNQEKMKVIDVSKGRIIKNYSYYSSYRQQLYN